MLSIETTGAWREMGAQIGGTFPDELKRCVAHFCPWRDEPRRYAAAVAAMRAQLEAHCPALLDETAGMAEASGINMTQLLAYRFVAEVRQRMEPACSVVFLPHSDAGPLLARNNDIENDFTRDIQLRRVCRPSDGPATIGVTYLGFAGFGGAMNEHGLGLGGTSAPCADERDTDGLATGVLQFKLMQDCRKLEDARRLLASHVFAGKSANWLIGDTQGDAALFECVRGYEPRAYEPPPRDWLANTNTLLSGRWALGGSNAYQQSSYARYGRIIHQLGDDLMPHRVESLKQLMIDIAMPGLVSTAMDGKWKTAYSQVMCLAKRTMHIAMGHPAECNDEQVQL